MRTHKDTDVRRVLPLVQAPTLVLHRSGDQVERIEAGRYVAAKIPGARLVELAGDDGIPWIGDTDAVLGEIEGFITGAATAQPNSSRRLATVLFTDIVESTGHVVEKGDLAWRRLLAEHDEVVRRQLDRHGGTLVDSAGDGVLATFDGPAMAVRCAHAMMADVRPLGLDLRAGVHVGEVELERGRVRGVAVHIGARLAGLAGPGEVLVSSTVRDLTAGSGLRFDDAGDHELRGIPERWRLYRAGALTPP
jgi:class 3 adenylate cyclase